MITIVDSVLYAGLAVVFATLAMGIFALFRGGAFGRSWSNRLMRARVLFQFVVVIILVAGFWLKQNIMG